jgi:hypothetical protein
MIKSISCKPVIVIATMFENMMKLSTFKMPNNSQDSETTNDEAMMGNGKLATQRSRKTCLRVANGDAHARELESDA